MASDCWWGYCNGELIMSREEKLKQIAELSNSNLLELYNDYVRYHHYNYKSVAEFEELYLLRIHIEDLETIILERMNAHTETK